MTSTLKCNRVEARLALAQCCIETRAWIDAMFAKVAIWLNTNLETCSMSKIKACAKFRVATVG
eukprot:scaffold34296_cov43-Cyclotella_meneghiniana.AAC.2